MEKARAKAKRKAAAKKKAEGKGCCPKKYHPQYHPAVFFNHSKSFIVSGERGRNRTYNLLIKSQLLCQLSYAPAQCGLERQSAGG
jgi:hypothetical protein